MRHVPLVLVLAALAGCATQPPVPAILIVLVKS
ncbi:MAG: hypothetical protein JWP72_3227, partial [Massilia sp.]|nr:hypothetical protein [Massilia sp.]